MDEQLITWMDWIWSSRCLELLCTSTQSSNLKWVSRGGINSPRHQTSCWLKAAERSTIGWSDAIFFRAWVHPVLLVVASTAHDHWQNCSDAIHRRCVGSSGAEGLVVKTSLSVSSWPSDGPTLPLTMASVHPVFKALLARLCHDSNWASDRPKVSSLRPSDHPVLLSSLLLLCNSSGASRNWIVRSSDGVIFILPTTQCTKFTDACTDGTVGSSDGVFSLLFFASST
jgi:hypothetical protein